MSFGYWMEMNRKENTFIKIYYSFYSYFAASNCSLLSWLLLRFNCCSFLSVPIVLLNFELKLQLPPPSFVGPTCACIWLPVTGKSCVIYFFSIAYFTCDSEKLITHRSRNPEGNHLCHSEVLFQILLYLSTTKHRNKIMLIMKCVANLTSKRTITLARLFGCP